MHGFNVNYQGLVDAVVADMHKSPEQKKLESAVAKSLVVKFLSPVREEIEYHEAKIKDLQAELDGPVKNAVAIKSHQDQIDYYRS